MSALRAPLPMPMRVLVKGPSTVCWVSDMGGPRQDFTFPRVIEEQILRAGRPVTVLTQSVPSQPLTRALRTWPEDFLGYSPDVVVFLYGWYESIHLLMPQWLERHANSQRYPPTQFQRRYRKLLLRKFWVSGAKLQQALDRHDFAALARWRRRRLITNFAALIERTQQVGSPLVLVLQATSPGQLWRDWFPGLTRRLEAMDREIDEMVTALNRPNVRYLKLDKVIDATLEAGEEAMPDGGHYTPAVHRAIGEELAREMLAWAETQPHLSLDIGGEDDTAARRSRRNDD